MAAEELLLCAEHDDYFAACGCGSISEEKASDNTYPSSGNLHISLADLQEPAKKKTTGSPKQQAWRSCVAESKGDMAKAKQLYSAMGY